MTENMKTIHVIIASRPGTWQKFLQNEISSYPFVKVDAVAYGSLTILKAVKQYQPDILLVDTSIPAEEAIAILDHVKLESPDVLIVIIADTNQQQRSFIKKDANYVVSTFDFKSKIQSIFDHAREGFPKNTGCIEDTIGTNL
jgi:chemotaxis response regulator CheB